MFPSPEAIIKALFFEFDQGRLRQPSSLLSPSVETDQGGVADTAK